MAQENIGENPFGDFIKALTICISRASVYGTSHPATQGSLCESYNAAKGLFSRMPSIDLGVDKKQLIINAMPMPEQIAGRLAAILDGHDIKSISVTSGITPEDFEGFVNIICMAPRTLESQGGFENAVKKMGLGSVRASSAQYVRIDSDDGGSGAAAQARGYGSDRGVSKPMRMDDMSAISLEDALSSFLSESAAASSGAGEPQGDAAGEEPQGVPPAAGGASGAAGEDAPRASSKEVKALLAQLQTFIGASGGFEDIAECDSSEDVMTLLQNDAARVRAKLDELLRDVREDKESVDKITREGEKKGLKLNLSREEIIAKLAELIQEAFQPLTVAKGAMEILAQGDDIPPAKREMILLATESINLTAQITAHIKNIVGSPVTRTPDRNITDAAYKG